MSQLVIKSIILKAYYILHIYIRIYYMYSRNHITMKMNY